MAKKRILVCSSWQWLKIAEKMGNPFPFTTVTLRDVAAFKFNDGWEYEHNADGDIIGDGVHWWDIGTGRRYEHIGYHYGDPFARLKAAFGIIWPGIEFVLPESMPTPDDMQANVYEDGTTVHKKGTT